MRGAAGARSRRASRREAGRVDVRRERGRGQQRRPRRGCCAGRSATCTTRRIALGRAHDDPVRAGRQPRRAAGHDRRQRAVHVLVRHRRRRTCSTPTSPSSSASRRPARSTAAASARRTEAFQFATVDALGVGDATLRHQSFLLAPVRAGFGMSSGKPVDGLIGFEVLARFVTTFDYGAGRIVLRRAERRAAPCAGTTIPFVFDGTQPMIACTIGGVPGVVHRSTPAAASAERALAVHRRAPGGRPAERDRGRRERLRRRRRVAGPARPHDAGLGRLHASPTSSPTSARRRRARSPTRSSRGNIGAGVFEALRGHLRLPAPDDDARAEPRLRGARRLRPRGRVRRHQAGKVVVADVRPGTPGRRKPAWPAATCIATVDGNDAAAGVGGGARAFLRRAGHRDPAGRRRPRTARSGRSRLTLRDYV